MTYKGHDVLELNYDRIGRIRETVERDFDVLDGDTGVRAVVERWTAPAPARPFTWTAIGLEEIAALRAFLDARKGMAVPFWLPSLQWDLSLAEPVEALDTTIVVRYAGYQDKLFGTTGARRHIALFTLGSIDMDCYQVTDADCEGVGEPETLTIDPAAVTAYPVSNTAISFLKLCRLENDRVRVAYPAHGIAQVTVTVRELPMEAPA